MPKISKVRIVNFEYNDGNRLIADELYDFANRDNDDALNVLINLANGGGKSVLVQLMMQPILPKAKIAGRKIESFFTKLTDHCFILLEWQKDQSTEKLLTGIAMAARATNNEDESARGMSVKYYTFCSNYASDLSNYSIVNLPLSKRENGRFIPAEFEAVRTIAKHSGNALVYYRDDDNNTWRRKLAEYGLVQNEWRTMEKLNAEEGGLGKFFSDFKTSDQMIDLLLIPVIEGKLESGSVEDHSLSTMLLSYAKQYAQRQDVLENKESYEKYIVGLQQLLPQAEALWNANDSLSRSIMELFGLSDALSAGIARMEDEQAQAEEKLEQMDDRKHHVEHEQASADFYRKMDAVEAAEQQSSQLEAEMQSLEAEKEFAIQDLLIQECAEYYQKLQTVESEISALLDEIRRREQGSSSDEELSSLKYSVNCAVLEELRKEEPRLAQLREKLATASRQLELCYTARKDAQQLLRSIQTEVDQLKGRLSSLREQTDRILSGIGVSFFRRIDGSYGNDELDEVRSELEASRAKAVSNFNEIQAQLSNLEEILAAIPQELADLSAQIRQVHLETEAASNELAVYHQREESVRNICVEYNLNFSMRFGDTIRAYLNSTLLTNTAESGEILRKIASAEEEIQAAHRGSVHVPDAVIKYLNSTGVSYNTCEKYLLRLAEESKITAQRCLDILQNYPAAAYGILMDAKAKEEFFSFEREKWLPAMVPIFTYEEMDKILTLKRTFSGAIAFYSEDSFADRANYISLLTHQKDILLQRQQLLSDAEKRIKHQLEEVNVFCYAESWESSQTQLIFQLNRKTITLTEDHRTLEQKRILLLQKKQEYAELLEESRNAIRLTEFNMHQLQEVQKQTLLEQDAEKKLCDQGKQLRDAQNQLCLLEQEIEELEKFEAQQSEMIRNTNALIQELYSARAETDGAAHVPCISGDWQDLLRKYRQLLSAVSAELAGLKTQLADKESRCSEYRKELSKRDLEEIRYMDAVYLEEKEEQLRKKVQLLEKQIALIRPDLEKARHRHSVALGELHSVKEKMELFGEPLERSQVGTDFQNRIREIIAHRKQIQLKKDVCIKRENAMRSSLGRLEGSLQKCIRPGQNLLVTLQEDFDNQVKIQIREYGQHTDELDEQEELVSSMLNALQEQFHYTTGGILDSLNSMSELLDSKRQGDRYFTLIDLIEGGMENARRAIGQILTDLKEFEHHHLDLIHQCALQGQRIWDGLRQMSASSRVTVYDGKPKKQMLRFDMPESVDQESAEVSIAREIDEGTKALAARIAENPTALQEVENMAKRLVSSRNLLRKYIQQESIGVSAYKIDRNPQNAGYRTWENTHVQNSGAEKFIVYFAVILSLISYTREELGGIRDKELRSVLILDNPFGATTSKHILEPMFAIAKHFRVQMICLSDIDKSDIINCFDIVIKAIVKTRAMSSKEILTHEVNEVIDHGFYRTEQLTLL